MTGAFEELYFLGILKEKKKRIMKMVRQKERGTKKEDTHNNSTKLYYVAKRVIIYIP